MANIELKLHSVALMRETTIQIILPNDVPEIMTQNNKYYERPMKTLFLLHGVSGGCNDWITGTNVNELAVKYNLAVIMPTGDNNFYLNSKGSGNKYEDLIAIDIIDYVRKTFGLAMTPEDTIIGGLSMGGFGAIHYALHFPEIFGKMFGLSSALIINEIANLPPDNDAKLLADYDYYVNVFGDLSKLKESENDPELLVKQRLAKGDKIQPIFMACGTEDYLVKHNREFRDFLRANGVEVEYRESPGIHEWKFWNEYLEPAILWALGE